MICGHLHFFSVDRPGCEADHLGQPCTVVVASAKNKEYFAGAGFAFEEEGIRVTFVDCEGKVLGEELLDDK